MSTQRCWLLRRWVQRGKKEGKRKNRHQPRLNFLQVQLPRYQLRQQKAGKKATLEKGGKISVCFPDSWGKRKKKVGILATRENRG